MGRVQNSNWSFLRRGKIQRENSNIKQEKQKAGKRNVHLL